MTIHIEKQPLTTAQNFLQSPFWAAFKSRFGWRSSTFRLHYDNTEAEILVLSRSLTPFFSLAYLPQPDFSFVTPDKYQAFLTALSAALRHKLDRNTLFIRYDLTWPVLNEGTVSLPLKRPLSKAPMDIQPPDTVILNLEADDTALLEQMHKKTRYNIKLAAKKGVCVRQGTLNDLPRWYALYKETSKRDRIAIHSLIYYQTFFEEAANHAETTPLLYLAEHDGDLLGGIIVLYCNKKATYVYGASSNIKRNLMGNYALQWQALTDARGAGCLYYDFFGIPPTAAPNHPMHGLYQFKTGFGGRITHYAGAFDFIFRPAAYAVYIGAELLRRLKKTLSKRK
jgi:lipid II:glycine glycyltransferase (peptidoglycan interpeptide bridge formation enzyme)